MTFFDFKKCLLKATIPLAAAGIGTLSIFGFSPVKAQSVTGPLQAFIDACVNPLSPGCQIGDKDFFGIGFIGDLDGNGTSISASDIQVTAAITSGFYNIAVDFAGLPGGSLANGETIEIFYNIQITDPQFVFSTVTVDSTIAGDVNSPDTLTKALFEIDGVTPIDSIVSVGGTAQTTNAISGKEALFVRDIYTPTRDGIFGAANNFVQVPAPSEVPGPLPLLGAGVAFSYSRKLRAAIRRSSSTAAH
jgi:hypothetical protein